MNNYTMDLYEIKRKYVNFSKKVSKGLDKPKQKNTMDMIYGISKSGSVLVSSISKELNEDIKIGNTEERLCDNLRHMSKKEYDQIFNNYTKEMNKLFPDEPIVLFDDTDISKRYGKKFEDLDRVVDASSIDSEVVNGYHVCEAVGLTKEEKQPISLYSEIYSCKSKGFMSKNMYTLKSIDQVSDILKRRCNKVFDRGYDSNQIIEKVDNDGDYFVIRLQDKRNLEFKGKRRKASEVAKERKGKIKVKVAYKNLKEKEIYSSYTKAILPSTKKEYTLVMVYGINEDKPMLLLTNRKVKDKESLQKVIDLYIYRWRIEEYFRVKKQEYDFENMRIRTLRSMNNMNLFLTIVLGINSKIIEERDNKLLFYKILERSKSFRKNVCIWLYQIIRGIKEILSHAKKGIKEYQTVRHRENKIQLTLL